MKSTELTLLALFKAPIVPLDDIAEHYLSMDAKAANARAARNRLEIPTFRLRDSRKAARMVKVSDLAAFIDRKSEQGTRNWELSQV